MISVYSAVWAMLNSSLMALSVMVLRRNTTFLRLYGTSSLVLLTTCCCLRMITPCVVSKRHIIICDRFFLPWIESFCRYCLRFSHLQSVLIFLWTAGTILFILIYLSCMYTVGIRVKRNAVPADMHINDILCRIDPNCPAKIYVSPDILVPVSAGILHPRIYLTDQYYDDEDLYYIILHEYIHWKRRDIYKKLALHLVTSIVWWNPFGYILLAEFNHILEIECDLTLRRKLKSTQEAEYMGTLYKTEVFAINHLESLEPASAQSETLCKDSEKKTCSVLRQRFALLLNNREAGHYIVKFFLICIILFWMAASYFIIPNPCPAGPR